MRPEASSAGRRDGFILRRADPWPVGWLATILGFGVTIAALALIYRLAYEATINLVGAAIGGATLDNMQRLIVSILLLMVFIGVAQRAGRWVRDWINAGRKVVRRSRPSA